jgi:hypothetical protein
MRHVLRSSPAIALLALSACASPTATSTSTPASTAAPAATAAVSIPVTGMT